MEGRNNSDCSALFICIFAEKLAYLQWTTYHEPLWSQHNAYVMKQIHCKR